MKQKRVMDLILLFFFGSVAGWIWEVIDTFFMQKTFANRGFLHGPWLPIYGFGILLIYFLKCYFNQNPAVLFGVSCIAFGVLEYLGSWLLESLYGIRWWNYQQEFMNLQGRICLKYVVLFSVAGCLIAYFVLPFLLNILNKMPFSIKKVACILLLILFVVDGAYSFIHPNQGNHVTYTNLIQERRIANIRKVPVR